MNEPTELTCRTVDGIIECDWSDSDDTAVLVTTRVLRDLVARANGQPAGVPCPRCTEPHWSEELSGAERAAARLRWAMARVADGERELTMARLQVGSDAPEDAVALGHAMSDAAKRLGW